MKVLITGASGLLGREVWRVFEKTHTLSALGRTRPSFVPAAQWHDADLADTGTTVAAVTRRNPDLVVHCAAYNDVDRAESKPEDAYRVNALGARNLALACQRFDTALMAVSTDYVFDGLDAPESGYREFDVPRPLSRYAESKRWAEILVEQLLQKYFIVRTSWLFGPSRATYVDRVLEWARAGQDIPCVKDMVSAPTYTPDLAEALLRLAESGHYGTYHLTNTGFCSRVDLAKEVLTLHQLSKTGHLKVMTQSQLNLPALRPAFSGLNNLAWTLDGLPPLRRWQDALRHHFIGSRTLTS